MHPEWSDERISSHLAADVFDMPNKAPLWLEIDMRIVAILVIHRHAFVDKIPKILAMKHEITNPVRRPFLPPLS